MTRRPACRRLIDCLSLCIASLISSSCLAARSLDHAEVVRYHQALNDPWRKSVLASPPPAQAIDEYTDEEGESFYVASGDATDGDLLPVDKLARATGQLVGIATTAQSLVKLVSSYQEPIIEKVSVRNNHETTIHCC
jgi:hypothetical protein